MIKGKLAKNPKILLVFDKPPSPVWSQRQAVTPDGIGALLTKFTSAGIDIVNDVSALCLSDVANPKAVDFNEKLEYVQEFLQTYAFNVVIPVGATAFDKLMGFKGIEKYFEKTLYCDKYNCKVLPCPTPSMIKYKPEVAGVINNVVKMAVTEMEFPEVTKITKVPTNYFLIDTIDKFDKFVEVFMEVPAFAFDLEATGFQHNVDEILTAQFTHKIGFSYLIPTQYYNNHVNVGGKFYWTDEQWSYIKEKLRKLFARKNVIIIGHNIKFDLKFINYHWNVQVPKPDNVNDTLAMAFLIDENSPNDLKHQACVNTDLGDYERELEDWKKEYIKRHKIKTSEFSYSYIPFEILTKYALVDTDATFRLWVQFKELLVKEQQVKPFKMLMRFSYVTTKMELNGWPVDVEYAKGYLKDLTDKIEVLGKELLKDKFVIMATRILEHTELDKINAKRKNKLAELPAPFEFNFNSSLQKRTLFFEVLRLPIVKYTKARNADGKRTTPAIDREVLDKWAMDHPALSTLLDPLKTYGELCKMRTTYVIGILSKAVDGRIHGTFNICGAKTGRLSSKNPNLQNLPVRNKEAKNVKRIFKARKGWVLLGADISAVEMRWACICSGDAKLTDVFNSGEDVHGSIAKEVFNLACSPNEVKKLYPELRDIAKTIQFLSIYGGGADALAGKVKIKPERAKAVIEEASGDPNYLVDKFKFDLRKAEEVLKSKDPVTALMTAFMISTARAQEILDEYFEKYPGIEAYINDTIEFTKKNGYSMSMLGRKRRVTAVDSDDLGVAERGVRQAVNSTIQSIASDGLMESVYLLQKYLDEHQDIPMLLLSVVHDAVYLEVREDFVLQARDLVVKYLGMFPEGIESKIEMVAEAEWGYDWAHFSDDFGETLAVGADEYDMEEEEEE